MNRIVKRTRSLALVAAMALTASLTGCLGGDAGAGAGAAGAVYYTERGASSLVNDGLAGVLQPRGGRIRDMKITETGHSTEENGKERELEGQGGRPRRDGGDGATSRTPPRRWKCFVRRNSTEWDKEYRP